jgi:hypothetical protein
MQEITPGIADLAVSPGDLRPEDRKLPPEVLVTFVVKVRHWG